MEKFPEPKIVGKGSEEHKAGFLWWWKADLYDIWGKNGNKFSEEEYVEIRKNLEEKTVPKTPEEIALIGIANEETNKLLNEYGAPTFEISPENVLLLKNQSFKQSSGRENTAGFVGGVSLGMAVDSEFVRDNRLNFATTVFHEMCHLKSYMVVEVEDSDAKLLRSGVRLDSSLRSDERKKDERQHFQGLNEAITASLEKKFSERVLSHPILAAEKRWLESDEARNMRTQFSKRNHIPESEIGWVAPDGEYYVSYYWEQRRVFHYVLEQIADEYKQTFSSREEVEKEFYKAYFTGGLLSLARLIEGTFGRGAFRELGEMTGLDDEEGGINLIAWEKLKNRRKIVLEQKSK